MKSLQKANPGQAPRIRELQEQADSGLSLIITNIYTLKGQAVPEELGGISGALRSELIRRYPRLMLAEVSFAMRKGVFGDYGDYFGLNIVTFIGWIKAYWHSADRKKFIPPPFQLQLTRQEPISEQEKENLLRQKTTELFERYKNRNGCNDIGNAVYDYLDSLGLIKFTPQEKHAFMDKSRELIMEEYSNAKASSVSSFCRKIIDEMEEQGEGARRRTILRAKKIALDEFFKRCLESGETSWQYTPNLSSLP